MIEQTEIRETVRVRATDLETGVLLPATITVTHPLSEATGSVSVGSSFEQGDTISLLTTPLIDFLNGKYTNTHLLEFSPRVARIISLIAFPIAIGARAVNVYDKFVDRIGFGGPPTVIRF